jgi:hypothetical protein
VYETQSAYRPIAHDVCFIRFIPIRMEQTVVVVGRNRLLWLKQTVRFTSKQPQQSVSSTTGMKRMKQTVEIQNIRIKQTVRMKQTVFEVKRKTISTI